MPSLPKLIAVISSLLFTSEMLVAEEAAKSPLVDFKRDIRPILSNRCFACHGPDESHVESGLRLDRLETATSPADSGRVAIVPKQVDESELMRRITSKDDNYRMPPPNFGGRLTDREIQAFDAWIRSGATYSKHWSFDTISPIELNLETAVTATHAIDVLVEKKRRQLGWPASPPASPSTLLRRLSSDLTGLPPTLDEQLEFESRFDATTYEQKVDELLASPAFGEHWGRKWLDLARYADSAGYADDPPRTIWAYRDWVIQAINQGMPFDQFTVEQLAGDLLPNRDDDQLVATAFHRNTLTNNEGGTNDEEFRNVALVDRVNTTMAVWMGLTMACAQCHNHKFDPISQKEYFQVFAIFNQTEDADRTDESPTLKWFSKDQRHSKERLFEELERLESQLNAPDSRLLEEQKTWSEVLHRPVTWSRRSPELVRSRANASTKIDADGRILVDAVTDTDSYTIDMTAMSKSSILALHGIQIESIPDPKLPGGGAAIGTGNFVLSDFKAWLVDRDSTPVQGRFVRVELPGENRILSLAEVQVYSEGNNIAKSGKATQSSTAFDGPAELAIDGKTSGNYTDKSTTHTASSASPWWELDLGKLTLIERIEVWNRTDNQLQQRLAGAKVSILSERREILWEQSIDTPKSSQTFDIQKSISIPLVAANADFFQESYPPKNALDNDPKSGWSVGGSENKPHQLYVAIDSEKLSKSLASNHEDKEWKLRLQMKFESATRRAILTSFAVRTSTDERIQALVNLPSTIVSLLNHSESLTDSERDQLHKFYVSTIAPSRSELRTKKAEIEKKLAAIQPITTVPILRELPEAKHRTTRIQLRGNYKVLGDIVSPDIPSAFHRLPSPNNQTVATDRKQNRVDRLQFARWLVQADNPLAARVLANRYWESFFGVGIVRSSEEFGSQGDLPSNPDLLDHLATELIRINWDTKRFIKSIVMSDTYQQKSSVTAKRFEEDPENIHLSRGPRFRVSAEQVRDSALAAAGLLSHKMFGPPVQPPQPAMGLKAAFGSKTDWDTSKGEDRFRRGIYTLWRRSNPYPSMATFDAPNREVCVLRRDRTNTPLQALVTLNDPVFVEAAQGLARRIVIYELPTASFDARIERLYRLVLCRTPLSNEVDALTKLAHESRQALLSDPGQATKLATEPLGPTPTGSDTTELAVWTTLCNVVLNLDEFLMTP